MSAVHHDQNDETTVITVYICNWIHATKNTTNIKTNNEKLNEIIKVKTEIHSDTGEIFGRLLAQNWT